MHILIRRFTSRYFKERQVLPFLAFCADAPCFGRCWHAIFCTLYTRCSSVPHTTALKFNEVRHFFVLQFPKEYSSGYIFHVYRLIPLNHVPRYQLQCFGVEWILTTVTVRESLKTGDVLCTKRQRQDACYANTLSKAGERSHPPTEKRHSGRTGGVTATYQPFSREIVQ